jgi:hypothetical protein
MIQALSRSAGVPPAVPRTSPPTAVCAITLLPVTK